MNKPFTNVMLDLETLDTKPTALILSIGAVAFDPNSFELGPTFYAELSNERDMQHQQEMGRTISPSTVTWWMQQSDEAKKIFAKTPQDGIQRLSPPVALVEFNKFLVEHGGKDCRVWGNGADFDNVVLGSLYDSYGIGRGWSYGKNRCYRTVKNICPVPYQSIVPQGVAHNALDDAVNQAQQLQEIFACLNRH